jgi:uncharacterized protein YdeI (YjbR/CyaY-like superfamily)
MELYFKTRGEWREWLERNHSDCTGVWLIYYKAPSGKPRIPYNDAVEEALCFGWIDGKIKRVNDDYYMQWFTPRRNGSRWSKLNSDRVQKLITVGFMRPEGLSAYEEAIKKPELVYEVKKVEDIIIPKDLFEALQKNKSAEQNFSAFSLSRRRLYVLWLDSAKKQETRLTRITKIVEQAEKNIRRGIIS